MEPMLRISAAAVCALLSCLLLKRTNPELAAALGMAAVGMILLASLNMGSGLKDLRDTLRDRFQLKETMMQPVLKCVATGIVTRLTADLCKDSSQNAVASAVEVAGSFCALGIIMPLLVSMLKMVGGFL